MPFYISTLPLCRGCQVSLLRGRFGVPLSCADMLTWDSRILPTNALLRAKATRVSRCIGCLSHDSLAFIDRSNLPLFCGGNIMMTWVVMAPSDAFPFLKTILLDSASYLFEYWFPWS